VSVSPARVGQCLDAICNGLADVVVDRLADHACRQLVEVSVEFVGEGKELRPEGLVLEGLWGADLHRAASSPGVAEGCEVVAATQGEEESSLPRIRQAVVKLCVHFATAELGEAGADPLGSAPCRLALAADLRPGVERFDLAKLLEQRTFQRQHGRSQARLPAGVTLAEGHSGALREVATGRRDYAAALAGGARSA